MHGRTESRSGHDSGDASLGWQQRRFLLVLGLPALGIAFAYTVVTTYAPVLLNQLAGPTTIGILIGGEGLLALVIPVLVGGWSDQLRTRFGARLPFVLVSGAVAAVALVLLPLGSGSLFLVVPALGVFLMAYFTYYAPYYALYPDLVPAGQEARSQGFQGGLRSAGLLGALVGGGVLLSVWKPLPFVLGAAAVIAVTACLYFGVRNKGELHEQREGGNGAIVALRMLRDNARIRNWAISNAFWEAGLGALRTFVVLYFTVGLGFSLHGTSGALALVGVAALVAAPLAGKLGDRYGPRRVMEVSVVVFALGLTPTLFTTNPAYVAAIVPFAFAAVILLTLPYSLLMELLPDESRHGVGAGLFGFSRGVGVLAGPLLAGFAIDLLGMLPVLTFDDTKGYSAIFVVASVFLLGGLPFLRRVGDPQREASSS